MANQEREEAQNSKAGDDSNVVSAIRFLEGFGSRVPPSVGEAGKGFYHSLLLHGLHMDCLHNGRLIASLRVPRRLCNSKGWLHGGELASLVDVLGCAAISSTGANSTGTSLDLNISYMSSAPAGEEIEIDARVLKSGKNVAVVSVDLRRKSTADLIAQGRYTKYLGTSQELPSSKL